METPEEGQDITLDQAAQKTTPSLVTPGAKTGVPHREDIWDVWGPWGPWRIMDIYHGLRGEGRGTLPRVP